MKITLTKKEAQLLVPEIYDMVDLLPNKIFGYSNKKVKRFLKKLIGDEKIRIVERREHLSLCSDAKKVVITIPEEVLDAYRFLPQSPFYGVLYDIVDEKCATGHRELLLTILSLLASDTIYDLTGRRHQKLVDAIETWKNDPDVYMELAQKMFAENQEKNNSHEDLPQRQMSDKFHKEESKFGDFPAEIEVSLRDNEEEVELLITAHYFTEGAKAELDAYQFGDICSEVVDETNKEFDCCKFYNGFDPDSVTKTDDILTARFAGYAAPFDDVTGQWSNLIEFVGEGVVKEMIDVENDECFNLPEKELRDQYRRKVSKDPVVVSSQVYERDDSPNARGESVYELDTTIELLQDKSWKDLVPDAELIKTLVGYSSFLKEVGSHDFGSGLVTMHAMQSELDENTLIFKIYFGIPHDAVEDMHRAICTTMATCALDELCDTMLKYVPVPEEEDPSDTEEEPKRVPITGLRKPIIVSEKSVPVAEDEPEDPEETTSPASLEDIFTCVAYCADKPDPKSLHYDCAIALYHPERHKGPKKDDEESARRYYLKKVVQIKERFMNEILAPIEEEHGIDIVLGRNTMTIEGDPANEKSYVFNFSMSAANLKSRMKAEERTALIKKINNTWEDLAEIAARLYN